MSSKFWVKLKQKLIYFISGMKNEFFFAIPKRKVTITYSVPGVSDEGPNIRGQVI